MTSRRTPFRSAIDQLASTFAEGVLRAIRLAIAESLVTERAEDLSPRAPRERVTAKVEAVTKRVRAPRSRRPSSDEKRPAQRSETSIAPAADDAPGVEIIDPLAVLGESWTSPTVTAKTITEAKLATVASPASPASFTVATPRLGEQVLRGAGGGRVLRRPGRAARS